MQKVNLLVIGAGGRGYGYSRIAVKELRSARIAGVAEPHAERRERMARDFDVPKENVFNDWREAAKRPRMADAVLICTLDALHEAPALAFIKLGYHVLLEKPMAPSEEACKRIVAAAKKSGKLFAVCHVLRYTEYTQQVKRVLDSGLLGEVASIQHLEPVAHWHQAHSFVRGNWRNEAESTFMLLSKSCHDVDWISYMMQSRCRSVGSFGSLLHFRRECQPAGAGERCVACGVERRCPYSAIRIYLEPVRKGRKGWPMDVVAPDPTPGKILAALETGPYGRCVYACDNDVVDNQVVNFSFEGGKTGVFTMTAFSDAGDRQTRIFGTHGELWGDSRYIRTREFLTGKVRRIDTRAAAGNILGGHGGGDGGLMYAFLNAILKDDPSLILSGPDETLETHRIAFAAERARRENRVVDL